MVETRTRVFAWKRMDFTREQARYASPAEAACIQMSHFEK